MANIRSFVLSDIDAIVNLRQKTFRYNRHTQNEALRAYFQEIFFDNPWYNKEFPSLVYEDQTGDIVGFLGVLPRRMEFKGETIIVAVASSYMVDRESRGLPGVQLMRRFLQGSQDVSLADVANDAARGVWERLGGRTALLYSLDWVRVLSPCRYFQTHFSDGIAQRAVRVALRPFCSLTDKLLVRIASSPFSIGRDPSRASDLDVETMINGFKDIVPTDALRPRYDSDDVTWLLQQLCKKMTDESLCKIVLQNDQGAVIGWYIYFKNKRGIGQVVQVVAQPNAFTHVLRDLCARAAREGMIGITGRVDPRFLRNFSEAECIIKPAPAWMLVHSREPRLLEQFQSGTAFVSRLEGEWWTSF